MNLRPRLLAVSFAVAALVSLGLPVLKVWGTGLNQPDGRAMLSRFMGHRDLLEHSLMLAGEGNARMLVAERRDILSALTWEGRDSGLQVKATPFSGPARHHWDLVAQLDPAQDQGPFLLILQSDSPVVTACTPQSTSREDITAGRGFIDGTKITFLTIPDAACLQVGGGNG